MHKPNIFYKYKGINCDTDLQRLLDIMINKKIYLPRPSKLNDPFEGHTFNLPMGIMGTGIYSALNLHHPVVDGLIDEFKILSFTELNNSAPMWAYYSNNYKGVCLGFKSIRTFAYLERVNYGTEYIPDYPLQQYDNVKLNNYLKSALLIKSKEWEHEKEWRLISKSNDDYICFQNDELIYIILGHNLNNEEKDIIIRTAYEQHIQILEAIPGTSDLAIHIKDINVPLVYDGSPFPEFIF